MSPNTSTRGAKAAPARRKLTDRYVRTVKPNAKRALYWDTVQAGLALSVEPSGHKAYKLVYGFHGRYRWYTIGAADRLGLKEARLIAREKMAEVYRGVDVQAERQAARKADTFDELAGRYREEYAKLRNRSWPQADTLVRTYLLPRWAKLPAHTIVRADVRAVFNKITRDGSPVLANQVLAAASAVFAWALKNDVANLPANPCSGIERNPTKARERVLSDRELPLFWACIRPVTRRFPPFLFLGGASGGA